MPTVTAEQLGIFIACLAALALLVAALVKIFRREPPLHREYASKSEHAELKLRVDGIEGQIRAGFEKLDQKRSSSVAGLHDDLEESIESLRKEVKEDIQGVHNRINDVLAAVSKLQGRVEAK